MKKWVLLAAVMFVPAMGKAESDILMNFGEVKILMPFTDVSAVYLFDGVMKQSLVGAETPLLCWHKIQLTGGAVTSIEGEGSPFAGINISLDNPAKNFVPLADIQPGVFAGRNFNNAEWIAGIKASVSVFE